MLRCVGWLGECVSDMCLTGLVSCGVAGTCVSPLGTCAFSNLVSAESSAWLTSQFPNGTRFGQCFDSSVDNTSDASTFHAQCDQYDHTLLILRNSLGYIFGGYASVSWSEPLARSDPRGASFFIFHLEPDEPVRHDPYGTDRGGSCGARNAGSRGCAGNGIYRQQAPYGQTQWGWMWPSWGNGDLFLGTNGYPLGFGHAKCDAGGSPPCTQCAAEDLQYAQPGAGVLRSDGQVRRLWCSTSDVANDWDFASNMGDPIGSYTGRPNDICGGGSTVCSPTQMTGGVGWYLDEAQQLQHPDRDPFNPTLGFEMTGYPPPPRWGDTQLEVYYVDFDALCLQPPCGVNDTCSQDGTCEPAQRCAEVNCGPHGTCERGVCTCSRGRFGDLCDQRHCCTVWAPANGCCRDHDCPAVTGGSCSNHCGHCSNAVSDGVDFCVGHGGWCQPGESYNSGISYFEQSFCDTTC
eukprot:COSAG04_NODE_480_length_13676_cov_4.040657_2_plen_461_part_00